MQIMEAINEFLTACRAEGLSTRTVVWYDMCVRQMVQHLQIDDLQKLTTADLRNYLAALRERPSSTRPDRTLSSATVRGHARGIKRFCNWLVVEGYLPSNPAARIKLPKAPRLLPRGISLADLQVLLAVADVRERAVLMFLIDTGCRAAELCALELGDLDLVAGTAHVIGKGRKERSVYLVESTRCALRAWLLSRSQWVRGVAAQPERLETPKVFVGQRGPLTVPGLRQILKRLARRAGVNGRCNPHAFRHALAREYLLNGGDLASLADILGHEDVQTTKIYSGFSTVELHKLHDRNSPAGRLAELGN
jgi:integrase/recombinase XerC